MQLMELEKDLDSAMLKSREVSACSSPSFLSPLCLDSRKNKKSRLSPHRPHSSWACLSESTKEKQVVKSCRALSLDHRLTCTWQELQEASLQQRSPTGLLRIVVFNTVSNQPDSSSQEAEQGILFVTSCDHLSLLAHILCIRLFLVYCV